MPTFLSRRDDKPDYTIYIASRSKSSSAEAFRTLRTNLQFAAVNRGLHTLLVTSGMPADGKTTVAANLAAAYAQAGHKTLVVDADLRLPALHKFFGVSNDHGLTNVLVGQAELAEAARPWPQVPNLFVLASGPIPPNPTELLGSERMRTLIERMKQEFEMIVFDLPPVTMVAGASSVLPFIDGALLVVRLNRTPRELVKRAQEQLDQVKGKLLGIVANRVGSARGYYRYRYYNYQYHRYYESDDTTAAKHAAASNDSR